MRGKGLSPAASWRGIGGSRLSVNWESKTLHCCRYRQKASHQFAIRLDRLLHLTEGADILSSIGWALYPPTVQAPVLVNIWHLIRQHFKLDRQYSKIIDRNQVANYRRARGPRVSWRPAFASGQEYSAHRGGIQMGSENASFRSTQVEPTEWTMSISEAVRAQPHASRVGRIRCRRALPCGTHQEPARSCPSAL
jgi:hypothetical protein